MDDNEELKWLREEYERQQRRNEAMIRGFAAGVAFESFSGLVLPDIVLGRVFRFVFITTCFLLGYISVYRGRFKWKNRWEREGD